MKSYMFDSSDRISIHGLLSVFQIACNINMVHERAWMSIFIFSTKKAYQSHPHHLYLSSSRRARQERKFTSWSKVLNYMLATYANKDIIAEDNMEFMNFKKSTGQKKVTGQAFWTKALCCIPIYDEYGVKGTFRGWPSQSVWQSVGSVWARNKFAWLQEPTHHALCLVNLPSGTGKPESVSSKQKWTNTGIHDASNIIKVESASISRSLKAWSTASTMRRSFRCTYFLFLKDW